MAQIIRFFPKQGVGPLTTAVTMYGNSYEIPGIAQIVAELRAYSFSGAGSVSAFIQDCMDPAQAPDTVWRDLASATLTGGVGSLSVSAYINASNLQRYCRGKFIVTNVTGAMLAFEGVGRETT